jgi:hypothetical protein
MAEHLLGKKHAREAIRQQLAVYRRTPEHFIKASHPQVSLTTQEMLAYAGAHASLLRQPLLWKGCLAPFPAFQFALPLIRPAFGWAWQHLRTQNGSEDSTGLSVSPANCSAQLRQSLAGSSSLLPGETAGDFVFKELCQVTAAELAGRPASLPATEARVALVLRLSQRPADAASERGGYAPAPQ